MSHVDSSGSTTSTTTSECSGNSASSVHSTAASSVATHSGADKNDQAEGESEVGGDDEDEERSQQRMTHIQSQSQHPHHPGPISLPPLPMPGASFPMQMQMMMHSPIPLSPYTPHAHAHQMAMGMGMSNMSPLHRPAMGSPGVYGMCPAGGYYAPQHPGNGHGVPLTPHGLPLIMPSMPPFSFSIHNNYSSGTSNRDTNGHQVTARRVRLLQCHQRRIHPLIRDQRLQLELRHLARVQVGVANLARRRQVVMVMNKPNSSSTRKCQVQCTRFHYHRPGIG